MTCRIIGKLFLYDQIVIIMKRFLQSRKRVLTTFNPPFIYIKIGQGIENNRKTKRIMK
jgi:hypothetical protein